MYNAAREALEAARVLSTNSNPDFMVATDILVATDGVDRSDLGSVCTVRGTLGYAIAAAEARVGLCDDATPAGACAVVLVDLGQLVDVLDLRWCVGDGRERVHCEEVSGGRYTINDAGSDDSGGKPGENSRFCKRLGTPLDEGERNTIRTEIASKGICAVNNKRSRSWYECGIRFARC